MPEISIAPTLLLIAQRFAHFAVLGTALELEAPRSFQKLLFFHCVFLPILFHIFFPNHIYYKTLKIKTHFLFFSPIHKKKFHLTSWKNLLLRNSHFRNYKINSVASAKAKKPKCMDSIPKFRLPS